MSLPNIPPPEPKQRGLFPAPPPAPPVERCPRCRSPLAVEAWGDRRCLFCGGSFILGGDGVLRAADVIGGRRDAR